MKLYARLLSAAVSVAMTGSALIPASLTPAGAEYISDPVSVIYDNTKSEESKVSETTASATTTKAAATTTTKAAATTTTKAAATTTTKAAATTTTKAATTTTKAAATTTTKAAATTTKAAATTTKAAETAKVTTTTEVPFNVFDIYNAHQDFIAQTTPVTTAPAAPSLDRMSFGIDVSQWQHEVDWQKVKADGVEYAIIRAGYGKMLYQEDPMFDTNMKKAQEAGIYCGTYWYSYATTVDEAYTEAMTCYEVIKDYNFTYPVFFDIEDSCQSRLSTAEVSAIIETFCKTLQDKGYYVGIYSYANFLTTRVYDTVLEKYDVWVAHFDVPKPAYSRDYTMWQYTSTGSVDGISNAVDLDVCYVNYPYIISPDTYVEPETLSPRLTTTSTTVTGTAAAATSTTTVPAAVRVQKGIDVSEWQGSINWSSVKDVDYVIVRAGYGMYAFQEDKYFKQNIENAHAAGLPCGAYWYAYATTPEEAVREAEVCYSVIKDCKLEFPVYYNIEDPLYANLTTAQKTAITDAFCSYLEEKGYYVAIQTYANFLLYSLDPWILEKYDVWVAHFGVNTPAYTGSYGMWKYTNSATVEGISSKVNASYCYYDYPSIMKQGHLNGY